MDYEDLFKEAVDAICSVQPNQVFVLRDLFEGHYWNALTKRDRLGFGGFFKKRVLQGCIPGVNYLGKASNNSAQYQKTEE